MSAAWIVEMVPCKRRRPCFEHADQFAAVDMRLGVNVWHVGEAKPLQGLLKSECGGVDHEGSFYADIQLTIGSDAAF